MKKILTLSLIFMIFISLFTSSFAGRCGCKVGCDVIVGELQVDNAKSECTKACNNFGGWNGNWTNADTGTPTCEPGKFYAKVIETT